jgi:hypothetical protein
MFHSSPIPFSPQSKGKNYPKVDVCGRHCDIQSRYDTPSNCPFRSTGLVFLAAADAVIPPSGEMGLGWKQIS